ncbi:hypothetical protein B5807_06762 [Epicoccum nigrum]|uniref:Uncharacterized protein n=1 Tax=Epicoccum nigrum TaxID=105696 RepID=A0A1Y2LY71_EPING|nr:hypothetical protein B5807_06762 [Epicoccum nigrum]
MITCAYVLPATPCLTFTFTVCGSWFTAQNSHPQLSSAALACSFLFSSSSLLFSPAFVTSRSPATHVSVFRNRKVQLAHSPAAKAYQKVIITYPTTPSFPRTAAPTAVHAPALAPAQHLPQHSSQHQKGIVSYCKLLRRPSALFVRSKPRGSKRRAKSRNQANQILAQPSSCTAPPTADLARHNTQIPPATRLDTVDCCT